MLRQIARREIASKIHHRYQSGGGGGDDAGHLHLDYASVRFVGEILLFKKLISRLQKYGSTTRLVEVIRSVVVNANRAVCCSCWQHLYILARYTRALGYLRPAWSGLVSVGRLPLG